MADTDMEVTRSGSKLTVKLSLFADKDRYQSSTGKSKVVYTSHGFQDIGNGLMASVTIIEPKKRK